MRGGLKLHGMEDNIVPDFTTCCHRAKPLDIGLRLDALKGQKINGEGNMTRHGQTKRRTWRTGHLGVDEATQHLVVAELTRNGVGDQEPLAEIVNAGPEGVVLGRVTADGLSDTWGCEEATNEHGAEMIPPPRQKAVDPLDKTGRNNHPRGQAISQGEKLGREAWKQSRGAPRRSLAETAM